MDMLEKLRAPIPKDRVKWFIGAMNPDKSKGMALAYIDARVVQDRLDEAAGPENWQSELSELPSGVFICRLGIRIDGEWIWKSDGAGKTDVEGEKGACSDALKRAGVQWGIARELYGMPKTWVRIKPAGKKSYAIEQDELPRLMSQLGNGAPPSEPQDAEPDDTEKDAINREEFFAQIQHAIETNGLDKAYVGSEMRRRAKGVAPTTEELSHQAKHITEHPELWAKPVEV